MATKQQVIDLHRDHPFWSDRDIADELGCNSAYVRATAKRNNLRLNSRKQKKPIPDRIVVILMDRFRSEFDADITSRALGIISDVNAAHTFKNRED